MKGRKTMLFGAVFAGLLLVVTLVGIELVASFFVPSWPARALVPRLPWDARSLGTTFRQQPWLADPDNAWGMRDRERTIDKPPGRRRAVLVGDSFVESRFTPLSLPAVVQQRLDPSERRWEMINFGVSATDPRSYYYRIRDVALALQPDALLVFFYAGNDFLPGGQGYSAWPRLIDPSPGASLLGAVMPRTNWLLVNRLRLADLFRGSSGAPTDATDRLFAIVAGPAEQRLPRLVDYVRQYIDPPIPDAKVAEILGRADGAYAAAAQARDGEQEYLLDWMLRILMDWEGGAVSPPRNDTELRALAGSGYIEATLSWLRAIRTMADQHGVPVLFFVIPVGSVDPDYARFWKSWPLANTWNRLCEELHRQLLEVARREDLPLVDLAPDLAGVPGTYRKLDGHWTQKGEALVAARVAAEVQQLVPSGAAPAAPAR